MADVQSIQRFFQEHLNVRFVAHNSPEFQDIRAAYIKNIPIVPLGIARPQTAEDVANVIRYIKKEGLKFSIRAGGHDLYGRSFIQDGIVIDMRDISYVQVNESNSVAQIGGGALASSVAKALSDEGMATALGSFPSVGYAGWATHGGYGPFAPNYGLGVDQIVGARLVNWEGQIVDANEGMLKALRGGGGAIGVIVELTVKIYPLKQILAGIVLFESKDIESTIRKIINAFSHLRANGLPVELGLQQSVVNTLHGKLFAIGFMWSSEDMELGKIYLQQVLNFGEVVDNSVIPTNLSDWLEESGRLPPPNAYGAICSARVRVQTDQIADILAKFAKSMPEDRGTLYSVHEIRGPSAKPCSNSIFRTRERHFLIECIGTAATAEAAPQSWEWALQLRHAIMQTEPANIIPGSYLPLNPPDEFSSDEVYGEYWWEFKELKKNYDPQNVFKNALPRFGPSDHV